MELMPVRELSSGKIMTSLLMEWDESFAFVR